MVHASPHHHKSTLRGETLSLHRGKCHKTLLLWHVERVCVDPWESPRLFSRFSCSGCIQREAVHVPCHIVVRAELTSHIFSHKLSFCLPCGTALFSQALNLSTMWYCVDGWNKWCLDFDSSTQMKSASSDCSWYLSSTMNMHRYLFWRLVS